jgi:hypothetical protein
VLEHHHIHVTYTQYCFPQAYDTKKNPMQDFCKYSTYQCVPSMYLRKIVRTWYVLVVQRTYLFVHLETPESLDMVYTWYILGIYFEPY